MEARMKDDSAGSEEHRLTMTVRDYECDVQGIVNNAVYLNYLEHARHRYLLTLGVDFVEMAGRGLNMVVTRMELDYRRPLRAGDTFTVTSSMRRVSRLRFRFDQAIILGQGGEDVLRAVGMGTVVDEEGRPVMTPELDRLGGGE